MMEDINVKKVTIGINPFGALDKAKSTSIRSSKPTSVSTEEMNKSLDEFSEISENLSKNAHKLEKQTSHASTSTKQLTSHIVTVNQSLEKLKSGMKKISTGVSNSSKASVTALKATDSSGNTFSGFMESSKDLDKIDKVVATLAQQINIFALNASIEAARSGEAGRGFTVVANEIKELSKETFKISEDIRTKIENFFSNARDAINSIHEIATMINTIKTNQAMIDEALEEQVEALNEALKNNHNVTRSSNSITDNILNVYKLSKMNTESIEKVIRVSHSLTRLTGEISQSSQTEQNE